MHLSRLRSTLAILVSVTAIVATGARAQDGNADPQAGADSEPQTLDELVDFVIRPTQDADEDEDIWNWDQEPAPSALETPIGPPLAGPAAGQPIGPPLAGPVPEPVEVGKITPRRVETSEPFDPVGVKLGSF